MSTPPPIDPDLVRCHERINSLNLMVEQRFRASDAALRIQTAELARRLDDLNHAYRRESERAETFVSRPVYDADARTLAQAMKATLERVSSLELWQSKILGAFQLAMALGIVNLVLGAVVLIRLAVAK